MGRVIVSPTSEPDADEPDVDGLDLDEDVRGDLALRWSGRVSLTRRILAVNVVALLLLAGGFFYLDSYRARLVDNRTQRMAREAGLIAAALDVAPAKAENSLLLRIAEATTSRIRLYNPDGTLAVDTRELGLTNFVLRDPDRQDWGQSVARFLDAGIDRIVGADREPQFRERLGNGMAWPDVKRAANGAPSSTVWRAPDRTPVITAAARMSDGRIAFASVNARDITRTVRSERLRLAIVLAIVSLISILLSLFLARTIVRPIRRLARAAVRVRLGRAREVVVPRLPSRRDELGMLARALSDMSLALRDRIDATEAFAADVTHEMKNPLASLRSAVDGLDNVKDARLRAQLLGIARDDVLRLDRLISDISEASRLDAQLSRAQFEPIDLGALLASLIEARRTRGVERAIRLTLDQRSHLALIVPGDGSRLERVFANLIDNAISFSPDRGLIAVATGTQDGDVIVWIDDEGPGVPVGEREAVFHRFHSVRPDGEAFGRHSGLGLAIARTIVEAHHGAIRVIDRPDGASGARFEVRLPLAESGQ